jgi:hypothetical protein
MGPLQWAQAAAALSSVLGIGSAFGGGEQQYSEEQRNLLREQEKAAQLFNEMTRSRFDTESRYLDPMMQSVFGNLQNKQNAPRTTLWGRGIFEPDLKPRQGTNFQMPESRPIGPLSDPAVPDMPPDMPKIEKPSGPWDIAGGPPPMTVGFGSLPLDFDPGGHRGEVGGISGAATDIETYLRGEYGDSMFGNTGTQLHGGYEGGYRGPIGDWKPDDAVRIDNPYFYNTNVSTTKGMTVPPGDMGLPPDEVLDAVNPFKRDSGWFDKWGFSEHFPEGRVGRHSGETQEELMATWLVESNPLTPLGPETAWEILAWMDSVGFPDWMSGDPRVLEQLKAAYTSLSEGADGRWTPAGIDGLNSWYERIVPPGEDSPPLDFRDDDGVRDVPTMIRAAWNTSTGEAGFDPSLDLNNDGLINALDLTAHENRGSGEAAARRAQGRRVAGR